MKRMGRIILALALTAGMAGCGGLTLLLITAQNNVRLVNNGDFPVQATVYFSADRNIAKDELIANGFKYNVTLQPGETAPIISRTCGEVVSVLVHGTLDTSGNGSGPEVDSKLLRQGTDYECRNTIVFTFDNGLLGAGFTVSENVQQ